MYMGMYMCVSMYLYLYLYLYPYLYLSEVSVGNPPLVILRGPNRWLPLGSYTSPVARGYLDAAVWKSVSWNRPYLASRAHGNFLLGLVGLSLRILRGGRIDSRPLLTFSLAFCIYVSALSVFSSMFAPRFKSSRLEGCALKARLRRGSANRLSPKYTWLSVPDTMEIM